MTGDGMGDGMGDGIVGGIGGGDFDAFRAALVARLGGDNYASWMAGLEVETLNDDVLTLSTETRFKRDMLTQRFILPIHEAWNEAVAPVRRVQIVAREKLSASAAKVTTLMPKHIGLNGAAPPALNARGVDGRSQKFSETSRAEEKQAPALAELLSPLDERSTFDRFAVDDSNGLAFAAARQVFSQSAPRETIYIYGQSGVGKTHLLHAIANEWRATRGPGCAYLTYANLQTGCVSAIFSNAMLALHKDLLAQDVVLIDDVHLLSSSHRTQTEILNLVNASLAAGKRLVIAGELTPLKLVERGVNERLADRLAGGLCVAMTPAAETLRLEVLRKRLEGADIKCVISDEALGFIARKFPQSMREAIGAFNQLKLAYGEREMTVGVEQAGVTLRAHLADFRRVVTLDDCLREAAKAYGLTEAEARGRSQRQAVVRARHAYAYVAREDLKESFPRIASVIGRDHSTLMSGYERAQALIVRDKKFQDAVKEMRAQLGL